MSVPDRLQRKENRYPEKIVFVIGIVFLAAAAVLNQLLPTDWWILPAMLVIWGVGAIVNAVIRFTRVNDDTQDPWLGKRFP